MYVSAVMPIGTVKRLQFWSISAVNQVLVQKHSYKDTASLEIKKVFYYTCDSLDIL